jgi:hypothetical protein
MPAVNGGGPLTLVFERAGKINSAAEAYGKAHEIQPEVFGALSQLEELGSAGPPPGSRVFKVPRGIAVVEDEPAPNQSERVHRFFVIEDDSELNGKEIKNPEQNFDPNTQEPIVTMEFTDNGREAFARVTKQIAERGRDAVADVLAVVVEIGGGVPGVGGVGEVGVVGPEDRPHHGVASAVDLPPAARVGGQFGGAPDADAGTGPQLRMLVGDLEHDRLDGRVGEAVPRLLRVPP